jgi:hypothetical protein
MTLCAMSDIGTSMPPRLQLPQLLVAAAALAAGAADCAAAPLGRLWAPDTLLNEPGFAYLAAPRLDMDPEGQPFLAASAFAPGHKDGFGYQWNGLGWSRTWSLGSGAVILWPVESADTTYHLVWAGGEAANDEYLFACRFSEPRDPSSVIFSEPIPPRTGSFSEPIPPVA